MSVVTWWICRHSGGPASPFHHSRTVVKSSVGTARLVFGPGGGFEPLRISHMLLLRFHPLRRLVIGARSIREAPVESQARELGPNMSKCSGHDVQPEVRNGPHPACKVGAAYPASAPDLLPPVSSGFSGSSREKKKTCRRLGGRRWAVVPPPPPRGGGGKNGGGSNRHPSFPVSLVAPMLVPSGGWAVSCVDRRA
jgi:hypothetical protein